MMNAAAAAAAAAAGAMLTCDWLSAADAFLGELLSEAVSTERFLITRSKLLADEHLVTAGARETLAVPRRSLVRYSTLVDHLTNSHQTL